jgi:predicted CRISPR-associated helicase cas3
MAMQSQAKFNALEIGKGYCMGSSARWYEDDQVPTRLGDETLNIYLAVWQDGVLRPLRAEDDNPWEQSAVRVRASVAQRLADSWQTRFASAIETLREKTPLLRDHTFILPLVVEGGGLIGLVVDERGLERAMRYSSKEGLAW